MGAPPPTGVAVKVYDLNVTPSGGVAVARAAVGPVASALVRRGAVLGVVMMASLETGLVVPSDFTPTVVTA